MHGHNNTTVPGAPPKDIPYTKRIPVPSQSRTTKTHFPPFFLHASISHFLFFYPGLLRRLFGSLFFSQLFPHPCLLGFSFFVPCFYWIASAPLSINYTSTGSLSLRLFSLAHLPFQLPAGMHVTSPFLSRQIGIRQVYGGTRCHFIPNASASSPFSASYPPSPSFLLLLLLLFLLPCMCLFLTSKHTQYPSIASYPTFGVQ